MTIKINNSNIKINGKIKFDEAVKCYQYQVQNTGGVAPESYQYTNCNGDTTFTDLINPGEFTIVCALKGTINQVGTGFPFTVTFLNIAC